MTKSIISILGIAIAGSIFFFFTQPTYDEIRATESQVAEYDEALQRAAELQKIKQSLLSRYNAFNPADIDRLRKLLPDHVDNVRLVLDLDNLAVRHGLALQNVVVSNPTTESRGSASVIASGKESYDSLTLRFSALGTYRDFRSFLGDLDSSLRIVDLVSLKLARSTSIIAGANEPAYGFEVTIRTYWLK